MKIKQQQMDFKVAQSLESFYLKSVSEGWGNSSVVECCLSISKALRWSAHVAEKEIPAWLLWIVSLELFWKTHLVFLTGPWSWSKLGRLPPHHAPYCIWGRRPTSEDLAHEWWVRLWWCYHIQERDCWPARESSQVFWTWICFPSLGDYFLLVLSD